MPDPPFVIRAASCIGDLPVPFHKKQRGVPMNVTPLPNNAVADVPIDRLAHDHALTEQQKVAVVSQKFEALLLRQILQETQKTVIPSKFADNSTAAGIYHDMVTKQLADSISKSGTLGLAQTLERQLTRQLRPASPAGPGRPADATPHLPPATDTVRPTLLPRAQPFQTPALPQP